MSVLLFVSTFVKQTTSFKYSVALLAFGLSSLTMMPPAFSQQTENSPAAVDPQDNLSINQSRRSRQIGEATSDLLSLQANGVAAGPALPMLGVTTNLSWQRYQDSFKFKIPEFFDKKVNESN